VKVFLAGATGVIGRRLVPALLAAGHEVTAMCRSAESAEQARSAGAMSAMADALDASAVANAVAQARPDAVVNQLTALPKRIDPRRIERDFERNDRLRSEGSRILAGEYGVTVMTEAQGASNERARRELAWQPGHRSWREGFPSALA
jgi:nucleoside-diphosphate-sugar epimerase